MHIFKILAPTIFLFLPLARSAGNCQPFICNTENHHRNYFDIHFPFRVPRNQSTRCGYPRFDLSCSSHGETFLRLPSTSNSSSSDPLIVREIDYGGQILWVSDPDGCIPKRVLNLNLTGTPYFSGPDSMEYSFLNCSEAVDPNQLPVGSAVIGCLSEPGFTVVATFEEGSEEKMVRGGKCRVIKRVIAPLWWPGFGYGLYPVDMREVVLQLSWDLPGCSDCVVRGGDCGFVRDSGLDVACFGSGGNAGLPRSAKYGLMLGLGIPGLLFMIALTFYMSSKVRSSYTQNASRADVESSSRVLAPQPIIITMGLDGSTIESYPKTVLGESRRLPKLSDGTCPICLSEYEPKESLRAIPECSHYFHADCIDEWLRMNATCPLCRYSPQK